MAIPFDSLAEVWCFLRFSESSKAKRWMRSTPMRVITVSLQTI